MRRLLLCLALWPFGLWAEVTVTLSPEACQPGDLVVLTVESRFERYGSFELRIPERADWFLVAHEAGPVRYTEGVYRQRDVVLFQPLEVGPLDMGGFEAVVRRSTGAEPRVLTLPTLEVRPYCMEEDSDQLAEFPEPTDGDGLARLGWWGGGLVIVLLLGGACWAFYRKEGLR